jgi:hypothetical protein
MTIIENLEAKNVGPVSDPVGHIVDGHGKKVIPGTDPYLQHLRLHTQDVRNPADGHRHAPVRRGNNPR